MPRSHRLLAGAVAGVAIYFCLTRLPLALGVLATWGVVAVLALVLVGGAYLNMRRSMLRIARQEYRIEWTGNVGSRAALPQVTALHERLESLGYQHVGDFHSSLIDQRGSFSICFIHAVEPIYALAYVLTVNRVVVILNLTTYFEGNGALVTTNSPWSGSLNVPRPPDVLYLLQQRSGGTPEALHGQHIGTLHPWAAGGRKPLPALRDHLEAYGRAQADMLREHLTRRGGVTPGDFFRILFRRRSGSVLRF